MRLDPVALQARAAAGRGEAAPQRLVHHVLEQLADAVDLLVEHPRDIRIEREGCSHEYIMSDEVRVKMQSRERLALWRAEAQSAADRTTSRFIESSARWEAVAAEDGPPGR